jgi:hypothetical protein
VTPTANTTYQITGITGTYTRFSNVNNGTYTITGLTNYGGANNIFQWGGTDSQIRVNGSGISFNTNTNQEVRLAYSEAGGSGYGDLNFIRTTFSGNDGSITTSSLTPVPLESDALPVLASAAFMAGGMWWKRKRAQAKVPELVAHKDHLKV